MNFIGDGFLKACELLLTFNADLYHIVFLSLAISLTALVTAAGIGIPLGTRIATSSFTGKRTVVTLFHTMMAMPTVVLGLLLYGLLSREGPLGPFDLLYTPYAVYFGQTLLALPIIVSLTISTLAQADSRIIPTSLALGASPFQSSICLLRESRRGLFTALTTSYGRIISEVGCALIIGGNIKDSTRVLTTAITLEARKGEFAFAIALGLVLVVLSLLVILCLSTLNRRTTAT